MTKNSKDWKSLAKGLQKPAEFTLNDWNYWEKARYYYEQAALENPDDAEVWASLSELDHKNHIEHIDKALTISPGNIGYLVLKVKYLQHDGEYQEAENLVNEILQLEPGNLTAKVLKASILEDQAWEILQKVDEQIKDTEPSDELFKLILPLDELEWEETALEIVDKFIDSDPDNKELWMLKYSLLRTNKYFHKAENISAEKLLFKFEVSVEDFCRTGQLGPVKLGMSQQEVFDSIGKPEDFFYDGSPRDGELASHLSVYAYFVWIYWPAELYFGEKNRRLYRISYKHILYKWKRPGSTFKVDPWVFRRVMGHNDFITYDEFTNALTNAGINYIDHGLKGRMGNLGVGTLELESGVEALYEEEDGAIIIGMLDHQNEEFADFEHLKS